MDLDRSVYGEALQTNLLTSPDVMSVVISLPTTMVMGIYLYGVRAFNGLSLLPTTRKKSSMTDNIWQLDGSRIYICDVRSQLCLRCIIFGHPPTDKNATPRCKRNEDTVFMCSDIDFVPLRDGQ